MQHQNNTTPQKLKYLYVNGALFTFMKLKIGYKE